MTKKYLESFREACNDVPGRKSMDFAIRLNDESELTMLNDIDIDPEEDSPVPDWVLHVLLAPNIPKRIKMKMILFHNEQIRTFRMRKAKGL